jgi:hypothetical protein
LLLPELLLLLPLLTNIMGAVLTDAGMVTENTAEATSLVSKRAGETIAG